MSMFEYEPWCLAHIARRIDITQLSLGEMTRINSELDFFHSLHFYGYLKHIFDISPGIHSNSIELKGGICSSYLIYKLGLIPINPITLGLELEFVLGAKPREANRFSIGHHPSILKDFKKFKQFSTSKKLKFYTYENNDLEPYTGNEIRFNHMIDKAAISIDTLELKNIEEFMAFVCLITDFSNQTAYRLRQDIAMQVVSKMDRVKQTFLDGLHYIYRHQEEELWEALNCRETVLLGSVLNGEE